MNSLAWAPPGSNKAFAAVSLPSLPITLTQGEYRNLLTQRLNGLMFAEQKTNGLESVKDMVSMAMPYSSDFLTDNAPATWAAHLMQADDLVAQRLNPVLNLVNWPVTITASDPQAALKLRQTGLEAWLMLAVPQETDG